MHARYIRAAWVIVFAIAGVGVLGAALMITISGNALSAIAAVWILLLAAALAVPVLLVQASIAARESAPAIRHERELV